MMKQKIFSLLLIIAALAAGQSAWAASTFSVEIQSSSSSSCTFRITRTGNTAVEETIDWRVVSLSAMAGVHFTGKNGEYSGTETFTANETYVDVTISESTPGDNAYKYQNGTSRKYRFEVLDRNGDILASKDRSITTGTSVPSSGIFTQKTVIINSGETNATHDGYINNPYLSVAGSSYYDNAAPKTWLSSIDATLHMTLSMDVKEVNDGYQYIQLLFDNTSSCDDRTKCSDGNPGNINLSRYMAGFGHHPGSYDGNWSTYTFPVTSKGNNCGQVDNPWGNSISCKLYDQKFKLDSYRDSDGKLIIPTSFTTLVLRLNASGDNEDTWTSKNVKAYIQAVDGTAPTVQNNYKVSGGRHQKGNTVYVSVPFSEIVKITGSTKKLTTSWGDLAYEAGDGTNVLTFKGEISSDATGTFSVTGYSGTIKDLAGNSFSGSISHNFGTTLDSDYTWSTSDFNTLADGSYEIYTTQDLRHLALMVNSGNNNCSGLTFKQTHDITYTHTTNWNNSSSTENNFTAIGPNDSNPFCGTYDGDGHTISGIRIYKGGDKDSDNQQGLFGKVGSGGTVKRVTLADARITGRDCTGGIAGKTFSCTIEDCTVGADVCIHAVKISTYSHGGIVGSNQDGPVRRCISRATLTVANASYCKNFGGIVGYNNCSIGGTITDCIAEGVVIPDVNGRGAIVGYKRNGTLTRNYYRGCTVAGVANATGVGQGTSESSTETSDPAGAHALYALSLPANTVIVRTPSATLPGTNNMTYNDGATIGGTEYYINEAAIPLNYSGEVSTGYHLVYSATAGTISGSTLIMPANDVTVTATVSANTYYVHFNKNGGVGEMVYQSFTYDVAQNLSTCTFSHSGEALAAWTTNADGTGTKYTNGQEVSNLTAENGAVIDLYAQWQHDWNFPEWTWTDNYSSATAHFTCLLCGETQNKQAFISAFPGENYLFSVEFGDERDWYCSFTGNNALHQGQQTVQLNQPYYICSGAPGHYRIRCPEASYVIFYSLKEDLSIPVENEHNTLLYRNSYEHYSDLEGNLDFNLSSDGTVYGVVFYNQDRSDGEATVTIKGLTVHTAEIDPAVTGGTVTLTEKKEYDCNWSSTHKINEDNIVWLTFTPDEPLTDKGVVWTVTDVKGQNVPVQYHEGNSYFIMPAADVTVSAEVVPVISYIDANGDEQTCVGPTPIVAGTAEYGNSGTAEAWYYVRGDVTIRGTKGVQFLDQQVNIILCDGATLTSNASGSEGLDAKNGSLAIYAQGGGSGRIVATATDDCAIFAKLGMDLNGGVISATTTGAFGIRTENNGLHHDYGPVTIRRGSITAQGTTRGIFAGSSITILGGTVSATATRTDFGNGLSARYGDVSILGGNVTASGYYGIETQAVGSTVTLGWSSPDDRITASSYACSTLAVKNGQTLTDGNAAYSGSVTASDIDGKTLRPDLWGWASGNDGSTEAKAFTITTTAGLDQLATLVNSGNEFQNKFFKLNADITYSHKADNEEGADTENNFTTIGVYIQEQFKCFCGILDGQGHTISGIRIYKGGDSSSDDDQGLFRWIYRSEATIKNVILADTRITGRFHVGGIVGKIHAGTVENCRVGSDVTIHAATNYADCHGGVVGVCTQNGTIRGCVSSAILTVADGLTDISNFGGIVGGFEGNMSDCLALDATMPAVTKSGAIAGSINARISTQTNCYHRDCTVGGNGAPSNTYNVSAYTVSAGTDVTVAPAGSADATYEYNGIKRYGDALYYGGVIYAPRDASVSLTLGYNGSVPTDLSVGYGASVGTLSGSANPYTLTMPAGDVTINAFFGVEVPYIDEKGVEHIATAIPLDNTMMTLAAGTYVVNSDVTFTQTVTTTGDVTLILADGYTMSFGTEGDPLDGTIIECNSHNLTIYGQSGGTGWLKAYSAQYDGIHVNNYTQYSGNVVISDVNCACIDAKEFTILGGTLDLKSYGTVDGEITGGSISILGGKLWARNKGIWSPQDITLGYTNATDQIYVNIYHAGGMGLKIADGKTLVDDNGEIWSGALYDIQIENGINNRTLKPVMGVTLTKDGSGNISAEFDGTSTTTMSIPVNVNVTSLTYNRTFTEGKPSTVMLPFSMDVSNISGTNFYTFGGVTKTADKWIATMNQVTGTLAANTPYLVEPTATTLTFTGGATLNTTGGGNQQTADQGSNWTFKGTYNYMKWTTDTSDPEYTAEREAEIGSAYGFAGVQRTDLNVEVGDFVKVASGAKIRPMGCYLLWKGTSASLAPLRGMNRAASELPDRITVRLIGADGGLTGIGELNTQTGEMTFDAQGWYTLDGILLEGQPVESGIYINNGKKVSIKYGE